MKKKSIFMTMLCCVLVSALTLGGTLAYLTAKTPTKNNVFTIGGFDMSEPNPDILLEEPNWKPENGQNAEPDKDIKKDPVVTNNSKTLDAYVFLEVKVPLNADSEELFSYEYKKSAGWEEITTDSDPKGTHIYAWVGTGNSTTMAVLGKNGGKTATLFDTVKLNNLKKLPTAGSSVQIDVTAYAIQTTLVDDEGADITAPRTIWGLIGTDSSDQSAASTTPTEPTE